MMKAVRCDQFGPAGDLGVSDVEEPRPGVDEALVRVEAIGMNFHDALLVEGRYQIKPAVPFIPGGEIAGTVVAVGANADPELVGRRVVVTSLLGGCAELACVPAADCVALPPEFDSPRAAGFAYSFCTAMYALAERGRLAAGDRVLVLGAGSGVGFAAVQVATALGASVIAGASTAPKRQLALAAGATAAVDTTSASFKTDVRAVATEGLDVVFDPIGGALAEHAVRCLGMNGRYLVVGFASGTIPAVPFNHILLRNRSVLGAELGSWARRHPVERRQMLQALVDMVARGTIQPAVPTSYPLAETGRALTSILRREVTGRVVVTP